AVTDAVHRRVEERTPLSGRTPDARNCAVEQVAEDEGRDDERAGEEMAARVEAECTARDADRADDRQRVRRDAPCDKAPGDRLGHPTHLFARVDTEHREI